MRKTRNFRKKILILLLIIFVIMQLIQPKKNISEGGLGENDISKVYNIPPDLHQTLQKKCYDCHSNNTRYPWYFHIQPIGWWLAAHVHDAKEDLNFSEFRKYTASQADHALEELEEVVEDKSMPLKAYTMFHEDTEITEEDEQAIRTWLASVRQKTSQLESTK
jgi:hypothetical protein